MHSFIHSFIHLFIHSFIDFAEREETMTFPFAKLVSMARDMGIATDGTFDEFIESLNQQGYLLKKRNREYELTGT